MNKTKNRRGNNNNRNAEEAKTRAADYDKFIELTEERNMSRAVLPRSIPNDDHLRKLNREGSFRAGSSSFANRSSFHDNPKSYNRPNTDRVREYGDHGGRSKGNRNDGRTTYYEDRASGYKEKRVSFEPCVSASSSGNSNRNDPNYQERKNPPFTNKGYENRSRGDRNNVRGDSLKSPNANRGTGKTMGARFYYSSVRMDEPRNMI